jgi:hypothetical protein
VTCDVNGSCVCDVNGTCDVNGGWVRCVCDVNGTCDVNVYGHGDVNGGHVM